MSTTSMSSGSRGHLLHRRGYREPEKGKKQTRSDTGGPRLWSACGVVEIEEHILRFYHFI